jgi:hypothetical protein
MDWLMLAVITVVVLAGISLLACLRRIASAAERIAGPALRRPGKSISTGIARPATCRASSI